MTNSFFRLFFWAVPMGLALMTCAPAVRADDARQLYEQATDFFEAGDYEAAARTFRDAWTIKPTWKLLYNIGQSEAAAKRYGHALVAFESYLVEGGDEIQEERREEVLKEISRIRPLVGLLEIAAPDGAEILVDGEPAGLAPLSGPLRLAARRHEVKVVLDGETLLEKQVDIFGEATTTLNAEKNSNATGPAEPEKIASTPITAPSSEAATSSTADTDKKNKGLLIAGIVTGALGLAGAGVGTAFFIKGNRDWDDYKAAAAAGNEQKYNTLKNDTLPADNAAVAVSFAAGGALLVTSAVLLVVYGLRHRKNEQLTGNASIQPVPAGVAITF